MWLKISQLMSNWIKFRAMPTDIIYMMDNQKLASPWQYLKSIHIEPAYCFVACKKSHFENPASFCGAIQLANLSDHFGSFFSLLMLPGRNFHIVYWHWLNNEKSKASGPPGSTSSKSILSLTIALFHEINPILKIPQAFVEWSSLQICLTILDRSVAYRCWGEKISTLSINIGLAMGN